MIDPQMLSEILEILRLVQAFNERHSCSVVVQDHKSSVGHWSDVALHAAPAELLEALVKSPKIGIAGGPHLHGGFETDVPGGTINLSVFCRDPRLIEAYRTMTEGAPES